MPEYQNMSSIIMALYKSNLVPLPYFSILIEKDAPSKFIIGAFDTFKTFLFIDSSSQTQWMIPLIKLEMNKQTM